MRISQVMLAKGFGGAERYFVDLSLSLAEAGHQIQVICNHDFAGLPILKESKAHLDMATLSVLGKWDPFAVRKLGKLIHAFHPEVIHAHLARGALLAGKALKHSGYPLVVKTHNYVNLKYYRDVDHFIVTTQDQQNYLSSHGIASARISHIPNFSRIPPNSNPRPAIQTSAKFAAYGRMVEKKGFDQLLKAFAETISIFPQARLSLGGDGPEREKLEALANNLGISKSVAFPGWVHDVQDFLSKSDIFVLPSLDEPFGIAIIEAMACGMPIIATMTQGPLEILHKQTAILVPIDDINSLSKAMQAALRNPESTAQLGINAQQHYSIHYHENAVVPKLAKLYHQLHADGRQTGHIK